MHEAIDYRERRAAFRWTAELVATPGAVGSLWASYWLAWATAQGDPALPIILKQNWSLIEDAALQLADWVLFRNNSDVRACAAETTTRLLDQPRQSPVIWPSKEIILYDVGNMRSATQPVATDGPVVMAVWNRNEDAMEHRLMAGQFISSLESGDLRGALSAVAWTLLTNVQQGLQAPLKCGQRGPPTIPAKARSSPIWFWLEIGRKYLLSRPGLHRGWITMHAALSEAFKSNYKRWTASDRMRILLAWILQLRASLLPQPDSIWSVPAIKQNITTIDLPYKEVAAELVNPSTILMGDNREKVKGKDKDKDKVKVKVKAGDSSADMRTEAKMAEADAAIMASLGIDT